MRFIKTDESVVYRHIEQLGLRTEIEKIAKEIMNQIDMPVVFEINYQGDRNYGRRHPQHHNQFWVQILPQEEESEFERLVLYLLYMGTLERRRVVRPMILEQYKTYLERIKNNEERECRIRNCKNTLGGLLSFASSMEAHIYLKYYGIETSENVKEKKFQFIYNSLKEYIALQKSNPGFHWNEETALNNIIDMVRTCWLKKEYHNKICQVMKQIKPKECAEKYTQQLDKLAAMTHEITNQYEINPMLDVTSVIVEHVFEILHMDNISYLKKDYFMRRECVDYNGRKTMRCAFVPEEIPRKENLIKGLRYLNTGLLLIEEYYSYVKNKKVPDPHVSIVISDTIQGWADGNEEKGYHISITTGLILMLFDKSEQVDLNSLDLDSCRLLLTEEEIRDRLYRYALFYVIVHEYIHILHGDCDGFAKDQDEKIRREKNADREAKYLVKNQLPMQYRPLSDNGILEQQIFFKNYAYDQLIFIAAQQWCDEMTGKI